MCLVKNESMNLPDCESIEKKNYANVWACRIKLICISEKNDRFQLIDV